MSTEILLKGVLKKQFVATILGSDMKYMSMTLNCHDYHFNFFFLSFELKFLTDKILILIYDLIMMTQNKFC